MSYPFSLFLTVIILLTCPDITLAASAQNFSIGSTSQYTPFMNIPVYPNCTPNSVSNKSQAVIYEQYETRDSLDKVFAYYQKALPEWGWFLEAMTDLGRQAYLVCRKQESSILLKIQRLPDGCSFRFSLRP